MFSIVVPEIILPPANPCLDRAKNYDNDGLLTVAGSEMISRNTATGQIEAITLGGTTETKLYNAFSEVSSIQGNAYAESMLYDNLGRISQKEETSSTGNHTYNYGYYPNGRLRTVSKDTVLEKTYNYDSNGNRMSVVGSTTVNGTYDDQDRLTSYGTLTFTYSNDGELTRKTDTSTSETTQYVTDALGNLKSVLLPSGMQIDYLTDGLNRRVVKKVNGTTTQKFLYQDQLKIVAELDASNALVSRFVYGTKSNIPDYMIKLGTTYRIFSDHLGSPRAVVNVANGSVAQAIEYDEFGNITVDTNPGFVPFGFAGCLWDNDTKLCRFGARDYSAEIGRWLSKDPIGFGGGSTNLYGYVLNDPINLIDPLGLAPGDAFGTEAAAGYDALNYINGRSVAEAREYAGNIYMSPDGSFSYTAPRPGTNAGSNPGPFTDSTTAFYHTHGAEEVGYFNNDFSPADSGLALRTGYNSYLGTPSQGFKFQNGATGTWGALPTANSCSR